MSEPVFIWAMRSSRPRGGKIITYATQLNQDGSLSCDCPGWIFKRSGARGCKHTRQVEDEANELIMRWRAGESLPELDEVVASEMGARISSDKGSAAPAKFGRVIQV